VSFFATILKNIEEKTIVGSCLAFKFTYGVGTRHEAARLSLSRFWSVQPLRLRIGIIGRIAVASSAWRPHRLSAHVVDGGEVTGAISRIWANQS
jgi:hypothetical protein